MELWKKKYGQVAVGYVEDFTFNKDYEKMGLCCGYEHCIENMPLKEQNDKSCPIFGHDCPDKSRCNNKIHTQKQGRVN